MVGGRLKPLKKFVVRTQHTGRYRSAGEKDICHPNPGSPDRPISSRNEILEERFCVGKGLRSHGPFHRTFSRLPFLTAADGTQKKEGELVAAPIHKKIQLSTKYSEEFPPKGRVKISPWRESQPYALKKTNQRTQTSEDKQTQLEASPTINLETPTPGQTGRIEIRETQPSRPTRKT